MAEEKRYEKDQMFIKSLYRHLMASPREANALRRAFGRPMKDDIAVYMAFLKTGGEYICREKEELYFLVACLFYLIERPFTEDEDRKFVMFETLLGRLYGNTDSTDNDIAFMVNCKNVNSTIFLKKFTSYARRCKNELRRGERLDYYKLLQDLKFWNAEDRLVQIAWASTITRKG